MAKVDLEDIKELFWKVIIPFHKIERDITLPDYDHRGDNDAEHSWSLAFLAMSLAPQVDPKLDVGKIAQFAIIHDVVEVYADDTSVWAKKDKLKNKPDREAKALKDLKKDFPQFPNVFTLIDEYESKNSNEAKFVYALDKFLNMLMIVEDEGYYYHTQYKLTKERVVKHLETHRQKAHSHPVVAKYYDELREIFDNNPDHFYKSK